MSRVLERLAGRRRAARQHDRYVAFREHVEPALVARPRVHRFAVPAVRGQPVMTACPVGVCIDTSSGGDLEATRAALAAQTVAPATVIETSLREDGRETRAPWLLTLAAGDRLAPYGLERLGQAATLAPNAAVLTFDDDTLDLRGVRVDPRLRPGPSPDHLLARDLTGGSVCVRPELIPAGVNDPYALALALVGAEGEFHAHIPQVLRHRGPAPDMPAYDHAAAVVTALAARDENVARVETVRPGVRRIRRLVVGEPSVEVIVCFRDRPALLRRCADSLLRLTSYERLRLHLVDNASTDPEVAPLLAELAGHPRVAVSRDDHAFNFSVLNNAAATGSDADVLIFLNNDTEVIEPQWVETLLEEAGRPEVGAVAPLLVHADGSVQHAGAAIGVHGLAGHPFAGLAPGRQTPFGTALDGTRNWLAVTAACLMIERWKFDAVGGFDERFTVAGNDVDLGLRLTAAGHRSLCVPHTRVVHDGSASRDPARPPLGDQERSRERYGDFLTVGDPFYHPALTLSRTDCSLRGAAEAPQL